MIAALRLVRATSRNMAVAFAAVSRLRSKRTALLVCLALAACEPGQPRVDDEQEKAGPFPAADRPVAHIISSRWSTEEARDRLNEASEVMDKAGIKAGDAIVSLNGERMIFKENLGDAIAKNALAAASIV